MKSSILKHIKIWIVFSKVSVGRREKLMVYGTDYPTKDGTCVRDYIHIVDLAEGHVAALKKMFDNEEFSGAKIYNLSTGSGNLNIRFYLFNFLAFPYLKFYF